MTDKLLFMTQRSIQREPLTTLQSVYRNFKLYSEGDIPNSYEVKWFIKVGLQKLNGDIL